MISRLVLVMGPRSQSPYWAAIPKPAAVRNALIVSVPGKRRLARSTRNTVPPGPAVVSVMVTTSPATDST